MRSGARGWSVVLAMVLAGAPGCLVLTVAGTSHEQLSSAVVDTRTTSHQADVSGQKCFVEQKTRVVSKVQMHREYVAAGILEALVGTVPAFDDNTSQTYRYAGYAMIADGLLAAMWTFVHNQAVVTSEDWAPTSDTGTCAR